MPSRWSLGDRSISASGKADFEDFHIKRTDDTESRSKERGLSRCVHHGGYLDMIWGTTYTLHVSVLG
jgi:hypothetical protein